MTKTMDRIWQNGIVGVGLLGIFLLGNGHWRLAMIPQVTFAQSNSPFAGMVAIPGGSFAMGRDNGPADEKPAHRMFLPTFYIDQDLVTVVDFVQFVQ